METPCPTPMQVTVVHVISIEEKFLDYMTADPHGLPGGFPSFWKHPGQRYGVNTKNIRFLLTIIVAI